MEAERDKERHFFALDCAVFARILQKQVRLAGVSLIRRGKCLQSKEPVKRRERSGWSKVRCNTCERDNRGADDSVNSVLMKTQDAREERCFYCTAGLLLRGDVTVEE